MEIVLFVLRLAVLVGLYMFLAVILLFIRRELKLLSTLEGESLPPPGGRLVVLEAGDTGMSVGDSLQLETKTSIGRSLDNTIILMDDSVSARHALVFHEGGQWWIEDMNSKNGTRLNGESVVGRSPLRWNDQIGLGRILLSIEEPKL